MSQHTDQRSQTKLVFYQTEHKTALEAFHLPDTQKQFTGMPKEMLQIALEDKHRFPVVIVANGNPVGFFVLYDGEERFEYSDHANSLVLRAFSINYYEQGNGYAKAALRQLKDFVELHFLEVEEIALAVNLQNPCARHVYLSCGFIDNGRTKMGRNGLQHILVMPMKTKRSCH
ncbi:GNAT family N-acetyltransferase [Paenibacillus planticolens]|uniref:GNAT family N-acetyltransferase n=1 Tax=Paenibacillus planticolens TaxID=2654976 RepID=A0ABX1ZTN7_9BACL|nr:GNAT family N-acetyltransferase [Paenibacillus planticolens]NOV02178.1 GNAT family N-acetyltransferase [Paenibacillus planticolens]